MKLFKINERISIVCASEGTRSGFRHVAHLFLGYWEIDSAKACYQNRTWERYQFESVLQILVEKTEHLDEEDKALCKEAIKKFN